MYPFARVKAEPQHSQAAKERFQWHYAKCTAVWSDGNVYILPPPPTPSRKVEGERHVAPNRTPAITSCPEYLHRLKRWQTDPNLVNAPDKAVAAHTHVLGALLAQRLVVSTLLATTGNVFVTGKGGVGKSHVLRSFVDAARDRGDRVAITAPTGVGAVLVNGRTVHSTLGIKPHVTSVDQVARMPRREAAEDEVRKLDILIIDEVSMVSADFLAIIDAVCKKYRRNKLPFGGLQMVFFGDFMQLAPVPPSEFSRHAGGLGVYGKRKPVAFAFESPLWQVRTFVLRHSFRHIDLHYSKLLDRLRFGKGGWLGAVKGEHNDAWPTIFGSNAKKDKLNHDKVSALPGPAFTYKKQVKGEEVSGTEHASIPDELELRVGARVMITRNMTSRGTYLANGDMGQVSMFVGTGPVQVPIVYIDRTKMSHPMQPVTWDLCDSDGKRLTSIRQLPLVLGWAFTAHKTQGLTMQGANVDMADFSFPGQAYVAMSRVRSGATISLAHYSRGRVRAHKGAAEYTKSL